MSDLNPYQAGPYSQGNAGDHADLSAQEYPFSGGTSSLAGGAGYYSAGYASSSQPDPYLSPAGSHMTPYSGPPQQSYGQQYHQPYGQPYSQQYPYPPTPYGPYMPYGPSAYWGGVYDPRRYEDNALGDWALGLGIASVFFNCYLGALCGIPAIVVGVKGMRAADEGRATNKGMSIAGVAMGSIFTAFNVIYVSFLIIYFSMLGI